MDSIIITGDVLRCTYLLSKPSQWENIIWLNNILKVQLEMSTKKKVKTIYWSENNSSFNAKEVYYEYNLPICALSWAKLYDYDMTKDDFIMNLFFSCFKKASLVIGFELPPYMIKIFNYFNIMWIDIIIHPVRFLSDIYFGIRSSKKHLFSSILIDDHFFKNKAIMQAQLFKAQSIKKGLIYEGHNAIFFAQTRGDKVQIKNGKFVSIKDYISHIKKISLKYNNFFVKRHPLDKSNTDVNFLLKEISNSKEINENTYLLMGSKGINSIYSLSSSTCFEANYFGLYSEFIYKAPFSYNNCDNKTDRYFTCQYELLNPNFWAILLGNTIDTKNNYKYFPIGEKNLFRNTLMDSWGYKEYS